VDYQPRHALVYLALTLRHSSRIRGGSDFNNELKVAMVSDINISVYHPSVMSCYSNF
jgi:hypothetical protein